MRILITFALSLLAIGNAAGAPMPMLEFKISRPYLVLNFLETSKGVYGTSPSLKAYIESKTGRDSSFKRLVDDYVGLNLDQSFQRDGFPKNRPSYRSTKDLIMIAAVQSNDMTTFRERIVGILHNTAYIRLMDLLQRAEPYYDKVIWKPYGHRALYQLAAMKKYEAAANDAFKRFRHLYRSSWPDDMPFAVALVPVPGSDGETAAKPYANSLCVDILTEEKDHAMRVGIILHEICHVLYAEQSPDVQQELEGYFTRNGSKYAHVAYNFFDEGMATASGNGWTYHRVTGKMDTAGWYANKFIDGFGHALYPLVSEYIREGRTIDSAFISRAIDSFGVKFPKAPYDFGIQLNHLTLYSDGEQENERNQVKQALYDVFAVYWLNFTTPILGNESLTFLKESDGAQMVLVDRDNDNTFTRLRSILPDLSGFTYDTGKNFVISYFDSSRRLIIIANIRSGGASGFFKALQKRQYMDPEKPYWTYE